MNIDICYIISHGFAARMLLQTGLIEQLTAQGKRIAIICHDTSDENFDALQENPLVQIYNPKIKLRLWDEDYAVKRRYFLEDIRNNTALWEKHIYSIFYADSKHPWKRIRPFIYYPIYRLIPFFPSIRARFIRNEDSYLQSAEATGLLQKINPKLVVSTYPIDYLESKFLYAAKKLGIKTLIHLLSWDNITCKGIFPVIPDQFIAWGPVMEEELKTFYNLSDEQIHVCGVPHFDQHIKVKNERKHGKVLAELQLNPEHPYLFVAMSSPRFSPYEIEIVEWLAAQVKQNKFGDKMQLVVRPHPQNVQGNMGNNSWLRRLDALTSDRVAIDYPHLVDSKIRWSMHKSDMFRLSYLLAGCSVCLNSGSTVSIDALMMDKPVILTSFDGDKKLGYWKSARRLIDYPHLKKFIKLGGATVTYNYTELSQNILQYIENPKKDKENRQYALKMQCYRNDGLATPRVVDAMLDILDFADNVPLQLLRTAHG